MGNQKKKQSLLLLLASGFALAAASGCSSSCKTGDTPAAQAAPKQAPQRTISQAHALADFDKMWEIVHETHFDPTFNGTDWDAVRDEFRPQAADALNRRQIRRVMSKALNELGQSHFGIIPGAPAEAPLPTTDSSDDDQSTANAQYSTTDAVIPDDSSTDGMGNADTGIDVRIIDRQAVVSAIRQDSPAHQAGVKTGWILSKFRSHSISERIEELAQTVDENEVGIHGVGMVKNQLQGPNGSSVDLTFLDGSDHEVELNIARAPMPGEFVKFGNLPPMSTHLDWSRHTLTSDDGIETNIGVISFNIWMMPIASKFERAMYELRDTDGIIIDLRGNPGGIGQLSSSISRFFMSEKGSLGTMAMRGSELQFNIQPVIVTTWGEPIDPYSGPIAVLTDSGSASTSEVFAGGLQSLNRIEVFGTRSAGMALPAGMDKLPSGDVLLHAIANFVTSTGYQLEHGGVIPDHVVELTREDLLKGIDSPKQSAMDWIVESAAE